MENAKMTKAIGLTEPTPSSLEQEISRLETLAHRMSTRVSSLEGLTDRLFGETAQEKPLEQNSIPQEPGVLGTLHSYISTLKMLEAQLDHVTDRLNTIA